MGGMNAGPPEDFVDHPVANAGKELLHEQNRLHGRADPSFQDGPYKLECK